MKKYLKIMATSLLLAALTPLVISCTDGKGETKKIVRKSDPVPVRILELQTSMTAGFVQTSGKVTTDHEAILGFKVGGVIQSINVSEGDKVHKGQLLASVDQREIDAIVAQARLGYEKSKRDFNRVQNLFKDSVVTLEQLQNATTALDLAQQQLQSAEFNKQFSRIVAPYEGYVLKKFVNSGQVIGIGDPVLRVNKTGDDAWLLRVNVSDKQWISIGVNDPVDVKLDAFAEPMRGTVLRRSEVTDPVTGTFSVDISLDTKATLASGMFGTAKIKTAERSNVWTIPYEAVLDANGNDAFVFVTDDYKTAVKMPIKISSFDQQAVSVKSGLEQHKAVIVSGSAYLTDKSVISIVK